MTGNGHMRHYVKSNTHIRQHFTAHAQHYEAQRSITMLYRPTVRDETNNAENVCTTSKYVAVIDADLK